MARTNRFAAGLARGNPLIGLWLNLSDPVAVEIVASSGFDWVVIDNEHAPRDIDVTARCLTILEAYGTAAIVRVPGHDRETIGQMLDIGAQTLLVPMVDTAEQARRVAAACEFPPKGTRGVSSQTRAGSWGRDRDFLAHARESIRLIVQIESARAVDNVDEILAVDGVDAAFVGVADLAASLGHLGDVKHPEVQAAVRRVTEVAQARGMPLGTLTRNPDDARNYLAQGYAFVGVGTDTALLARALSTLREGFA
jgi:4-hydroxy-2-oxoheptanedioate aldolase